ncbi:hypothetical protein CBS101457_003226 [Exobasidium rhododendri]|nr:hypothetical protein CBS101457_003226 [Exobasidium rhododendri]
MYARPQNRLYGPGSARMRYGPSVYRPGYDPLHDNNHESADYGFRGTVGNEIVAATPVQRTLPTLAHELNIPMSDDHFSRLVRHHAKNDLPWTEEMIIEGNRRSLKEAESTASSSRAPNRDGTRGSRRKLERLNSFDKVKNFLSCNHS